MSKQFIITVDTEGDNLWNPYQSKDGYREITTNNAHYLDAFQELCEKYGFKPTYLTNYEMAIDDHFRKLAEKGLKKKTLEIGMHMHAWNSPPLFDMPFNEKGHNPFAGEYPYEVLKEKTKYLTDLLTNNFQTEIVSHRGGRWYLDRNVIKVLEETGYKIDCSVTPGISWTKTIGNHLYGPDYSKEKDIIFNLSESNLADSDCKIIEVPPTIIPINLFSTGIPTTILELKLKITNSVIWLRPNGNNLKDLLYIVRKKSKANEYLEFMIHSSELMPGGSPTFPDDASIKKLYQDMELLFGEIKNNGYEGICLKEIVR